MIYFITCCLTFQIYVQLQCWNTESFVKKVFFGNEGYYNSCKEKRGWSNHTGRLMYNYIYNIIQEARKIRVDKHKEEREKIDREKKDEITQRRDQGIKHKNKNDGNMLSGKKRKRSLGGEKVFHIVCSDEKPFSTAELNKALYRAYIGCRRNSGDKSYAIVPHTIISDRRKHHGKFVQFDCKKDMNKKLGNNLWKEEDDCKVKADSKKLAAMPKSNMGHDDFFHKFMGILKTVYPGMLYKVLLTKILVVKGGYVNIRQDNYQDILKGDNVMYLSSKEDIFCFAYFIDDVEKKGKQWIREAKNFIHQRKDEGEKFMSIVNNMTYNPKDDEKLEFSTHKEFLSSMVTKFCFYHCCYLIIARTMFNETRRKESAKSVKDIKNEVDEIFKQEHTEYIKRRAKSEFSRETN